MRRSDLEPSIQLWRAADCRRCRGQSPSVIWASRVCAFLSANSSSTTPLCRTTRRSTSRLRIAHTAGTAGLTYFTLNSTPKYQPHTDTHAHTQGPTQRMLFKHTSSPWQAWVLHEPQDPSFYKEGFIPLFFPKASIPLNHCAWAGGARRLVNGSISF